MHKLSLLIAGVCVMALATNATAGVVTLDIQVDTNAMTWEVFAAITDATSTTPGRELQGIVGAEIDVIGSDGITVTGSVDEKVTGFAAFGDAQTVPPPVGTGASLGGNYGFSLFPSSGVNGIGITGGQDTVGPNASTLVHRGVGLFAGVHPNVDGGFFPGAANTNTTWAANYLMASGTYSGTAGTLDAIGVGGNFSAIHAAIGDLWVGPGDVEAVSVVNAMVVIMDGGNPHVPEPGTAVLFALGSICLLPTLRQRLRRKRA